VVEAALPALRRAAAATAAPYERFALARALRFAGRAEAGPLLRDTLNAAVAAGDLRLAAALVRQLTGMTYDLARTQGELTADLRVDPGANLPATLGDVIEVAERTNGVRFGELNAVLQPDTEATEEILAEILRAAASLPAG
jgi:hypothetical protein